MTFQRLCTTRRRFHNDYLRHIFKLIWLNQDICWTVENHRKSQEGLVSDHCSKPKPSTFKSCWSYYKLDIYSSDIRIIARTQPNKYFCFIFINPSCCVILSVQNSDEPALKVCPRTSVCNCICCPISKRCCYLCRFHSYHKMAVAQIMLI